MTAETFAWRSSRICTQSKYPFKAAIWRAVIPPSAALFTNLERALLQNKGQCIRTSQGITINSNTLVSFVWAFLVLEHKQIKVLAINPLNLAVSVVFEGNCFAIFILKHFSYHYELYHHHEDERSKQRSTDNKLSKSSKLEKAMSYFFLILIRSTFSFFSGWNHT